MRPRLEKLCLIVPYILIKLGPPDELFIKVGFVEELSDLRNAVIVIAEFECFRYRTSLFVLEYDILVLQILLGVVPAIMGSRIIRISQHISEDPLQLIFCQGLMGLFNYPVSENSIRVRAYHTSRRSIRKRPFGHVASLFIYQYYGPGNIAVSLGIVKKNPWHLSPMNIPQRHVGVDVLHVRRKLLDGAVIPERRIVTVPVVEDGWTLESAIDSSV